MSHEDLFVNGDLLRLRREARGWLIGDMATRACMSVKQIRQLEEGGVSAFYSVAVKATAAKKVAALLGLTADEVLGQVAKVDETPVEDAPAALETADAPSSLEAALDLPVVATTQSAETSEQLTPSEPESPEVAASQETKSKTSLWVIVGLFLAALAVAAYMQPQEEPAVEPAPPLQVVPSEAADSASTAQPSASSVPSVADNGTASAAQKPSAPAVAVASAPVASASVATRPASAAASVVNPAPAASKAP